jgi:hypothetical protein
MGQALTRRFRGGCSLRGMLTFNVASTVFSSMAGESFVVPEDRFCDGTSFLVFDLLRDQLHSIFWMIPMFTQAKVSLDRVDDFLRNVGDYYFPDSLFNILSSARRSCWMSMQMSRKVLSASC